jgi:hypothetical protein
MTAHCSIECDGGSFDLKRESPTTVLLHNNGFVLVGGCGAEADELERSISYPARTIRCSDWRASRRLCAASNLSCWNSERCESPGSN